MTWYERRPKSQMSQIGGFLPRPASQFVGDNRENLSIFWIFRRFSRSQIAAEKLIGAKSGKTVRAPISQLSTTTIWFTSLSDLPISLWEAKTATTWYLGETSPFLGVGKRWKNKRKEQIYIKTERNLLEPIFATFFAQKQNVPTNILKIFWADWTSRAKADESMQ